MTDQITCYRIPRKDGTQVGFKLCIVDSPGFGDSRGKEFDKTIIDMVKELFETDIQNLEALCLVVKLGDKRLTESQLYVFSSILELFAKDISDNMFVLITNDDGESGKPKVLGALRDANVPFKEDMVFRFNNANLFSNESHEEWKTRNTSFKRFFDKLQSIDRTSVEKSKTVLKTRENLEIQLNCIQRQIRDQATQILQIKDEKKSLKEKKKDIENNENYTITREVQRPTTVYHPYFCLNCTQCNKTCHFNCKVVGDIFIRTCAVMSWSGYCNCGCYTGTHTLQGFSHEKETVNETETLQDIKKRYDVAQEGVDGYNELIDKNKNKLRESLLELDKMIMTGDEWIKQLQKEALKPAIKNLSDYIDRMITNEKESCQPKYEERIEFIEEVKQYACSNKSLTNLVNDL